MELLKSPEPMGTLHKSTAEYNIGIIQLIFKDSNLIGYLVCQQFIPEVEFTVPGE